MGMIFDKLLSIVETTFCTGLFYFTFRLNFPANSVKRSGDYRYLDCILRLLDLCSNSLFSATWVIIVCGCVRAVGYVRIPLAGPTSR